MIEEGSEDRVGTVSEEAYRWKFADAEFDEARWELLVAGTPVRLERKPLEVLVCLLRHAGEVVTKDELLDCAWAGRIVVEGALTNAIGKLRQALHDVDQSLIVTVPRVGYRLMGKVERKAIARLAPACQLHQGDTVPRRPNWQLARALDQSGGGEVWLAEHAKTHESRVFKFSFDGSRLGSLKREATISRLLHDSLGDRADFVRVIDWDFEDAPYFIESEYGGPDLEHWAQAHGGLAALPLSERIAWLAETADAVAAAHDVGVLHKDLKPANVLVRGEPGDWHPRLVDFGSGRVLDPSRLEALGITRLGLTHTQGVSTDSLTGTPLYLAPELLSGQVPTVRSDIYALGVMLFQLCVGDLRRPLSAGWENEIDDPLLREDIASAANGNPALRFASAREFAAHLQALDERRRRIEMEDASQARLVAQEAAMAESRVRRPWILGVVAVLAIGLLASLYFYYVAQRERDDAQQQLEIAATLNDFLTDDLLRKAGPDRAGASGKTVHQAIDDAVLNIGRRFDGKPAVEGTVRLAIAHAYDALSDLARSEEQYRLASALLAQSRGPDDRSTLDANLGFVNVMINKGDRAAAEEVLKKLEEIAERFAVSTDIRAEIYAARGSLADANSLWEQAIAWDRKALDTAQSQPSFNVAKRLRFEQKLAHDYTMTGNTDKALPALERAIHTATSTFGARDTRTLSMRIAYCGALINAGKIDDGLAQARQLLVDSTAVYGKDDAHVGSAHALIAGVYTVRNRPDIAATEWKIAHANYLAALGPDSPYTGQAAQGLAENLRWSGRPAEALDVLLPALEIARKTLAADSPDISVDAYDLAMTYLSLGNLLAARKMLPLLDRPVLMKDSGNWKAHLDLLDGRIALAKGRTAEAREKLKDADQGFETDGGDDPDATMAKTILDTMKSD